MKIPVRRFPGCGLSFVAGSFFMCLFATGHKMTIGAPIVVKGYLMPFIFGGSLGIVFKLWHLRLKQAQKSLKNSRNELRKSVEERTCELKQTNKRLEHEIDGHRHTNDALRESEEKYRLLVENANDAIIILQNGSVKFHNKRAETLLGYSTVELAEGPFIELIHPEDRDKVVKNEPCGLDAVGSNVSYSLRITSKAGEELCGQVNAVTVTWKAKPARLLFVRDITLQKKLEAEISRVRKMEAVGRLAGGIAHNFNNLLMIIQGNASLMLSDLESSYPCCERLKSIEQAVQSGAILTRQLLDFARGGKYEVRLTDINNLIRQSSEMFGRTKKEIRIHRRYQKDIYAVEADKGQIEQVLMNLYVNAWQAMPAGGELFLETENVVLDEKHRMPFHVQPGNYVKISVTDTGMGMDEATRQRIFEPFFTTKEMGRGTGLGLASVYGIIKDHGGYIDVYSEKAKGTAFTIYLPASGKQGVEKKKPSKKILKGEETILLVDDEEMVIDVGSHMLKKLGYKTLTARSGKEAIEVYKANENKIDMVILDMIMPDMGGGETYDRIKTLGHDVKVLLSSGYSMTGQAGEILKRGCKDFIQKPFSLEELSLKTRQALDENQN